MTAAPALRLAAVSDVCPQPRRGITVFTLSDPDVAPDALPIFAQFAVMLGANYAVYIGGIVHLLPANRGARS